MNKFRSILAYALMGAISGDTPVLNKPKPSPDWKRKKCKSCYNFTMAYQQCSKNPNNKACKLYCKHKR